MKAELKLILALALVFASQNQLMTYDPVDTPVAGTRVITPALTSFKWLILNFDLTGGAPGVTTYKGIIYDSSQANNYTEITETINAPVALLAGTDEEHSCAILANNVTNAIEVWKFGTTLAKFADITSLVVASGGSASSSFAIADDCLALKIDNKVFHWNAASASAVKYEPDTVPSWTSPHLDEKFVTALTSTAIYEYDSGAKSYTKQRDDTFYSVNKIHNVNNNIVLLSFEQSGSVFNFKLQINQLAGGVFSKLDEVTGTSTTQPVLTVSKMLSKVVVQGTKSDSSPLVIVRSVDWMAASVKTVNLPPILNSVANYIAVNEEYLYARNLVDNSNTQKNHSGYKFKASSLIPFFDEVLTAPQMTDWIKTLVMDDNTKLILIHETNVSDVITLTKDERKSFTEVINEAKAKTSPDLMTHTHGTLTTNTDILRPENHFKWLYSEGTGPTVFKGVIYKNGETDNKIVISHSMTGLWVIIAGTDETHNCAILFNQAATNVSMLSFDESSQTVTVVEELTTYFAALSVTDPTSVVVQVADNCDAFRIGDKILHSTGTSPKFAVDASANSWSSAEVDESFKIAINGQSLYTYSGSAYTKALDSSFYADNTIWLSADESRVYVLTSEVITANTAYRFAVRHYVKSGSNWSEVDVNTQGESSGALPTIRISPDYTLFAASFVSSNGSNAVISKHIKSDNTVSMIRVPEGWAVVDQVNYVRVDNDFAYFRKLRKNGSTETMFYEAYYSIDKNSSKYVELGRRDLTAAEMTSFQKVLLQVNSGVLTVVTEHEDRGNKKITLTKREVGSKAAQQRLSGVEGTQTALLIKDDTVIRCPTGCKICSSEQICQECSDGFILDSTTNLCSRCKGSCATCSPSDSTQCATCFKGGYLSGADCLKCDSNCFECANQATECSSCTVGMVLSGTSCVNCPERCEKCTSASVCEVCKPGFTAASNGTCIQCTKSCSLCKADRIMECDGCRTGFELTSTTLSNGTVETKCVKCPDNCDVCEGGVCSECRNGYKLIQSSGTCAEACRLPCSECSTSDPTSCTSCIGNYVLSGTTCSPDVSCNNDFSCTSCPIGYVFLASQCFPCQTTDSNCKDCSTDDLTVCTACNRGYYLADSGSCTQCSTNCLTCTSETTCTKCAAGYTISGNSTESSCLACESPCATCYKSTTNCQTCISGYAMASGSWKCEKTTKVVVTVRVNADISTISTDDIINMQTALKTKANRTDSDDVSIDDVYEGSVVFEGSVAVDSESDEASVAGALASEFAVGSTFAGYSVESSSFTGANQSTSSQDDNTAAILIGVLVPVSIIIICVVLFVLYKKGIIFSGTQGNKVADTSSQEIEQNNIIKSEDHSSVHQFEEKKN